VELQKAAAFHRMKRDSASLSLTYKMLSFIPKNRVEKWITDLKSKYRKKHIACIIQK
jgi:hypothetical protein